MRQEIERIFVEIIITALFIVWMGFIVFLVLDLWGFIYEFSN